MTNLEKASFVLEVHHGTASEELDGKLHINVSEHLNVAIHDEEVEFLAEQYDNLKEGFCRVTGKYI